MRLVKAIAVLVATGLALAAAGCFHGDDDEAAPSRVPAKLSGRTVVEGAPGRPRALLRRAVDGMQQTTLRRIAIVRLVTRDDNKGGPAVALSFVTVGGASVRRQWDEWIVAGAFSRHLQTAGLPAEVSASDRTGSFTARPRLRGHPDPRPLSRREETAIVRAIRNAARRSGGEVVRLEVHRPYGVALALSLATDAPARFLKEKLRPLMQTVDVHRPRLEGFYLGVLDEDDRLVVEWGSWTRNPAGSYWVRRDLSDCSPIRQSEPPGAERPPACPV